MDDAECLQRPESTDLDAARRTSYWAWFPTALDAEFCGATSPNLFPIGTGEAPVRIRGRAPAAVLTKPPVASLLKQG